MKTEEQLNEEIINKAYDNLFPTFELGKEESSDFQERVNNEIARLARQQGKKAEREKILNKIKDMQLNDDDADWYKEEPKEDMWIKCCKRILNNLRNPKTKEGE